VGDYEQLFPMGYDEEMLADGLPEYWKQIQPALANAFGLIQQSMEMALKGRIAAVSPYLLISRDPQGWPKGVDTQDLSFSEFRTLDAADLVKVHNTFHAAKLDNEFRTFWDGVRADRNKTMHSVPRKTFDTAMLIRSVLTAAFYLYNDQPWGAHCVQLEANNKFVVLGVSEDERDTVVRQIDIAIRHLKPAEAKRLLGYEAKRRHYMCADCYDSANKDYRHDLPMLAHLTEKSPTADKLYCAACAETQPVIRIACTNCEGNVLSDEGMCLTCLEYTPIPEPEEVKAPVEAPMEPTVNTKPKPTSTPKSKTP
jgi:hypothetical protein